MADFDQIYGSPSDLEPVFPTVCMGFTRVSPTAPPPSGHPRRMAGSVIAVLVLNQVLLVIYSFFIAWERLCTVTEVTTSQLWKLFLSQFVNTGLLLALINANFQDSLSAEFPVVKLLQIGVGDYYDLNAQWFTAVGATLVITILMQVFSTTIPPLVMSYCVQPVLARIFSRAKATQETINDVYTLPKWNLSLRLAQTLNVTFCVMMYSGGMPVLYPIGLLYCIVAYWLDRWCLLRGSRRPPQYTQDIHEVSMHFLPWAAFLHVLVAAWTFGNQSLFPSRWSVLFPLGEAIFQIDEARYDEVTEMYRSGAVTGVTWDLIASRLLDFSREGTWLLMLIFLACSVYYAVYYSWLLFLRPFLKPIILLVAECMARTCPSCCCARSSMKHHDERSYEEATKFMERRGLTTSYHLFKNEAYKEATKALEHTEQKVRASSTCEKSPTDSSASPTMLPYAPSLKVGGS